MLLFLHGGPGFPQMPFAHQDAALEKAFVVVQWDQRGAGKSYSTSVPASSMNVEQFVADACELTQILRARFDGRKIYLVAHSWGTVIGAWCVARHPEWFHLWADMGYRGRLVSWIKEHLGLSVEVVQKPRRWGWYPADVEPTPMPAFTVLKRRWVVERTFAWLGRYRRLSRDYEYLPETEENVIYVAMSRLMLGRLCRAAQ